ncbi:uncharacterized protein HMPREF1541_00313 [Cyphellophora europaea CBS 101466]|uniref:Endonuclease/exonuclease/phosphatase domain-containing protein n=1 Tax=Cyphellophora europaea (strain CBS 101466) TaxID=1220924 RepID=W2SDZ1_CYPE1|nr:uncharacterized protein HMPREF1541_00313 [Cyphellophora europaea CBS 101466]ETN46129.1 hypothetical protein HMPREF1541_00313 [Cyphellophora europaea CBS 101466]
MSSIKKRPLSLDRAVTPPPSKKIHMASNSAHVASAINPPLIKIVSWNVNGVNAFLQKKISFSHSPASSLRQALRTLGWPHFLCLQEVKIAPSDLATQNGLRQAANEKALPEEPTYEIVYSLPRDRYNATGFGGKVHGVATLIRKDFYASITSTRIPEWDREGRILLHEFQNLVLINGYWINGTANSYRSPHTGEPDGDRHSLKLRYHRKILNQVLQYERAGKLVVLVGDMNVARAHIDGYPNLREYPSQHVLNRRDFNEKFFGPEGMNGVDVFRYFHGSQRKYTWHHASSPHGTKCDRVDLIIASKALVEDWAAVIDSDICDDAQAKQHSDHVPLWLTLDLSKCPLFEVREILKAS